MVQDKSKSRCCLIYPLNKSNRINVWVRKGTDMAANMGNMLACSVAKLCLTLCDPIGCSLPGFSVHGIPQARILEWVARLSSRGSFSPSIEYVMSPLAGGFFTTRATWETQIDELKDIS